MIVLKKGSKGEDVKLLQKFLNLYQDGIFGKLTEEAVKEFQKENGLIPDGVVGQKTWAKLSPLNISKRVINEIIVHCTTTKEGQKVTVAQIEQWHKKRGFTTIGYHYVIYLDGTVNEGRNVNIAGAHTINHNTHSIGVCYVGGLDSNGNPKDTRTEAQKSSLLSLIKQLKVLYPKATVHGHREFANKACPCFDAKSEYRNV